MGDIAGDLAIVRGDIVQAKLRRIAESPEVIDFLESRAAPGGEISRYRLTVKGSPASRQVGWTRDDRIFLFR
jgi:hypothetical protein